MDIPSKTCQHLNPGMAVIHSNQMESLRALIVEWTQGNPLTPLEHEIIWVQSNGMSQWLKIALADHGGLGICSCITPQLPGRFLWHAYQTVLIEEDIPDTSPFDKAALTWRLYRLLPSLLANPSFTPLRQFLDSDGDARKRHQLAGCLADLLDQYQVYRADWLQDWAQSQDQTRDAHGKPHSLPPEQSWQAELWRSILQDIPNEHRHISRALLHERFIAALQKAKHRPANLPRRIIVFGVSSLPQQMLKALAALGKFCQILLCVHNPCQYYWADIIEHKELLCAERRRQPQKPHMPINLKDEELHLHANPLLASWGKQGRDYIRLLDELDNPENYQEWFQRINLFDDFGEKGQRTLLQQIQQAILELNPLPQTPAPLSKTPADTSLVFHIAHNPQREVEILHDQLLALFADKQKTGGRLLPRDIIVMVPDIDTYAPHISAVFGQIEPSDPRHIPYSLTDQKERGQNPLMLALESLLHLPESRFSASNLMDLLDVPSVRLRFAIEENELPKLRQWIDGSNIRWGLNAEQREQLGLPAKLEQNSWRFGLKRMLLGYALGNAKPFHDIEPYDEIGGLDAALIGPLATLLDTLETHWRTLSTNATPTVWVERLQKLMDDFFIPSNDRDQLNLERLEESLSHWEELCLQAQMDEELPLNVVREAWLESVDEPTLTQRFLAGRVNFCTLLPMRAIPFQVVCLMGMNDGDYPRNQLPMSFDLTANPHLYRPGDRSRREDDRYLFLEALLSARERLYISWIGRNAQDNSERPPSLLVGQLRDYVAAGWRTDGELALLDQLTTTHPLQAFSKRYFLSAHAKNHDPRLFSYAYEWRSAHQTNKHEATNDSLPNFVLDAPLTLETLANYLRYPVKAFFIQRLKVRFDLDDTASEDTEPFTFDRLQEFSLGNELLQAALAADANHAEADFNEHQQRQKRQGRLPLAGFSTLAQESYAEPAWNAYETAQSLFNEWHGKGDTPLEILFAFKQADHSLLRLEDWLPGLYRNSKGQLAQILVYPQALIGQGGKPKWHNLIRPWVSHLAACASGTALQTLLAGPNGTVTLPPIPTETAYHWLETLVDAWHQGMSRPLPLACKTAFAWLAKSDDPQTAAYTEYHGSYNRTGEVQQDAYLKRAFPKFDMLTQTDNGQPFEHWTTRLYAPLWNTWHNGQQDTP